jgi:hypothetical protein
MTARGFHRGVLAWTLVTLLASASAADAECVIIRDWDKSRPLVFTGRVTRKTEVRRHPNPNGREAPQGSMHGGRYSFDTRNVGQEEMRV